MFCFAAPSSIMSRSSHSQNFLNTLYADMADFYSSLRLRVEEEPLYQYWFTRSVGSAPTRYNPRIKTYLRPSLFAKADLRMLIFRRIFASPVLSTQMLLPTQLSHCVSDTKARCDAPDPEDRVNKVNNSKNDHCFFASPIQHNLIWINRITILLFATLRSNYLLAALEFEE